MDAFMKHVATVGDVALERDCPPDSEAFDRPSRSNV